MPIHSSTPTAPQSSSTPSNLASQRTQLSMHYCSPERIPEEPPLFELHHASIRVELDDVRRHRRRVRCHEGDARGEEPLAAASTYRGTHSAIEHTYTHMTLYDDRVFSSVLIIYSGDTDAEYGAMKATHVEKRHLPLQARTDE